MHGIHKGPHVFWVHVRIKPVAKVGNVALWPKAIQHLLYQLPDLLLGANRALLTEWAGKPLRAAHNRDTHTLSCFHSLFTHSTKCTGGWHEPGIKKTQIKIIKTSAFLRLRLCIESRGVNKQT